MGLSVTPSEAGNGWPPASDTPPADTSKPPSSNVIGTQVHYEQSYTGSGVRMTAPATANWSPPLCWYEPEFTPAEFSDYINNHYVQGSAWETMGQDYGGDDFHKGDKGAWWQLIAPTAAGSDACAALDPWKWITPEQPSTPDVPTIDPKTLAGLAFDKTILPEPDIRLRPLAQNQLVNLDTEIAFDKALPKVWVTASLDNAAFGIHVAATTAAVPQRLVIDAGTPYADPASCTYNLKASGGSYSVNTKDADCNVTYTKASNAGYSLKATVVWKVIWTPSADPAGAPSTPALPDGQSSRQFTVTVREDQTVNR
ncbi:putative secreted protein [Actinacidiphila reveromycinica]|uniref:Putative secreted protein n=1 Tax=Actinacidiphila reveromycinica TaxID=659352 RepID=A0A7U3URJ9_9ACTN|nr:putative secreted protein [Streptomyces sp. SN-593]